MSLQENAKNQEVHQLLDVYPSELNAIKSLTAKLQSRYTNKKPSPDDRERFSKEAIERFAEIGFVVAVEWDVTVPEGGQMALVHIPRINFVGRTEEQVVDHERMQSEITSGELDGQAGYIREDGSKREDPLRKLL